MDLESVRTFCLSLPHATERVQWGNDLLFCIGGKMFAVAGLDAKYPTKLSFKCTPEKFSELIELDGIVPAPYVARYHWVALEDLDALSPGELKELLKNAHQLVHDKLPRKIQAELAKSSERPTKTSSHKAAKSAKR
jgi:predicted DNA-binding protein (MmcQ/YjbR family)